MVFPATRYSVRTARALINLILLLALSWHQTGSAEPNTDASNWTDWKKVGSATLTWGFWTIYDSELRTPNGQYNDKSNAPLALVITYRRNIDAEDLLDATVDQWEHLGYSKQQIADWLPEMTGVWPNVSKGDRLIYVLQSNAGQFYYQPRLGAPSLSGTLSTPALAKAFSAIWLSPSTSYPSLRLALIGRKPE